jgi:hypothetical protein
MDRVDELFGAIGGEPEPRWTLVTGLLISGLLLSLFGMACTAVPGGLVVLAAWMVADADHERLQTGYLPADTAGDVRRLRGFALAGLLVVLLLFVAQMLLLYFGFYDTFWGLLIQLAAEPAEA